MRNTAKDDLKREVTELAETLMALGRKRPLRDPIALAFEEAQFTPAQIHSLLWLGSEGELTMGALAQRVGITEKTITGVVDRMEREDYLLRERSEEDRRVVHVKLTKKGQGVFKRCDLEMRERMGQFLQLLDPDDRCALLRILRVLVERTPEPQEALTHGRKER